MDARMLLGTTVYSSAFSPCGNYLATSNNFGYICIFDFKRALTSNIPKFKKPILSFKAHKGPVYSLTFSHGNLISAGFGPIAAWKWSDVLSRKPAMSWTFEIPCEGGEGSFATNDVNSIACNAKILAAGVDDNFVRVWDLASGKFLTKLQGHTDYIHDVKLMSNSNGLVSASEDGFVKVWDLRTSQCTQSFEPSKHKDLSRPASGKWIGCVGVDENNQWMVCGGGPAMSLWHLRSESVTPMADSPDFTPYTVTFHEDLIIAGGDQHGIHHWYTNGTKKTSIPCTVGTVFSLAFNNEYLSESPPMIAGGTGYELDVFCNLGYKSHTLSL